jgi:protein TonB
MIQTSPQHRRHDAGEIVVLPRVADVAGSVPMPGLVSGLGRGDLANVVPFRRPKTTQSDAPPCVVDAATRPMPPLPTGRRQRFSLALAATVLMHGAAFAAFFYYQPKPLASIGIEAISVEIVAGSNTLAGLSQTPSPSEIDSKLVPPEEKRADEVMQPPPESEKPVEQALAEPEKTTEAKPEPPKTEDTKPVDRKPAEVKAVETKRPEPTKPEKKQARTETRERPTQAPSNHRIAASPAPQKSSASSNGAGVGRSDASANYIGEIRSHIMRFQQVPQDAIDRGQRGTAIVRFTYDASGRVTLAKIVQSSGFDSIDRAAVDTVQRASPLPAPPPEHRGKYKDIAFNFIIR